MELFTLSAQIGGVKIGHLRMRLVHDIYGIHGKL